MDSRSNQSLNILFYNNGFDADRTLFLYPYPSGMIHIHVELRTFPIKCLYSNKKLSTAENRLHFAMA